MQQRQPQYAPAPAPAPAPAAYPHTSNYPPASHYPPARAQVKAQPAPRVVVVKVPPGVKPGQEFDVTISGRRYTIPCPPNVSAGMEIEVEL